MRYVQVNSVPYGSTGTVMRLTHEERRAAGDESWMCWGRGRPARDPWEFNYGSRVGTLVDVALTRLDGHAGMHSAPATRRLMAHLDAIDPDVVHLHNLHGYHVNIELLFGWLAGRGQRTVWTLHDCWALTGHCAHFTLVGCDQWRKPLGCGAYGACPQTALYPRTYAHRSPAQNWQRKRAAFRSLDPDLVTIVTPSQWLADRVAQSYLSCYRIEVRPNPIDTSVFKPTESDFRARHGVEGRFVVMGAARPWTPAKGLDDFIRLARDLDERFAVVLVGLSRTQARKLPPGIVAVDPIASPQGMAAAYSAADVFVNPSLEETFGMTVAEALECGTRTIAYEGGACAETARARGGIVVDGYEGLRDELLLLADRKAARP